jgi:hypothetical protein
LLSRYGQQTLDGTHTAVALLPPATRALDTWQPF